MHRVRCFVVINQFCYSTNQKCSFASIWCRQAAVGCIRNVQVCARSVSTTMRHSTSRWYLIWHKRNAMWVFLVKYKTIGNSPRIFTLFKMNLQNSGCCHYILVCEYCITLYNYSKKVLFYCIFFNFNCFFEKKHLKVLHFTVFVYTDLFIFCFKFRKPIYVWVSSVCLTTIRTTKIDKQSDMWQSGRNWAINSWDIGEKCLNSRRNRLLCGIAL